MTESLHIDRLYRFSKNKKYPDPVEEIDALCSLDADDEETYLLLAGGNSPPLSGATCGEVIGLCTSKDGRLILHGIAVVAGNRIRCDTPQSVKPIYNELKDRSFLPLKDLKRQPSQELPETILNHAEQETFLKGQAFVKNLKSRDGSSQNHVTKEVARSKGSETTTTFPRFKFSKDCSFTVVGLDPTAGTWESQMSCGPKKMPSFALKWNRSCFEPMDQPLAWHETNEEFRNEIVRRDAALICIDGPCGTNGPKLKVDDTNWEENAPRGIRGCELTLSREGINLFWTTQNTVMKFDGASRWIARSLVLFNGNQNYVETHPHGAFTFLWRMLGGFGTLPKKSRPDGRNARLAILRSFIPALSAESVPNHDAMDAACAALVAGLHKLNLTKAYGSPEDGGQIWMPDGEKIMPFMDSTGSW